MNSKKALEVLKEIIGEEHYREVIDRLAGSTVYFPENHEWHDRSGRNIMLREDFYSGEYEIPDLAKKYDLSISHVYKIIQKRGGLREEKAKK